MASNASTRLLTVEEFLKIDFGPEAKVELDNGTIRMMAGARARHNQIQTNLIVALGNAFRGSGCRPYGSDTGLRTHDLSLRYPDVAVYCGRDTPENDDLVWFDNPRVVVEILSESTAAHDQTVKLLEYKATNSVEVILFVDLEVERIRILHRKIDGWSDQWFDQGMLDLRTLGRTIAVAEIFSRA